jgi:2-keto-3-deoxy-L-rhamnonate aldolase RhmA
MERDSIRARLRAGIPVYGLVNRITDPSVCEVVAQLGFDFVMVDMEHAPSTWPDVQARVIAGQHAGMSVMVRTASSRSHEIGLALDLGADGVHVPHITSTDQAHAACRAAFFRPVGTRGFALSHRGARYGAGSPERLVAEQNAAVLAVLHIEDVVAVDRVADIAAIGYPTLLFVAPFDLTSDLGVPGDLGSHLLWEAYDRVAAVAGERAVPCGTYMTDLARLPHLLDLGYRYFLLGSDLGALRHGAARLQEAVVRWPPA